MKTLLAAAVLFFQAGSVIAGSCRVIEYTELKDTSSKDLARTYCRYNKLVKLHQEHIEGTRDLYRDAPNSLLKNLEKDIAEHTASLNECLDTQIKILSALRNRSEPANPSCEE